MARYAEQSLGSELVDWNTEPSNRPTSQAPTLVAPDPADSQATNEPSSPMKMASCSEKSLGSDLESWKPEPSTTPASQAPTLVAPDMQGSQSINEPPSRPPMTSHSEKSLGSDLAWWKTEPPNTPTSQAPTLVPPPSVNEVSRETAQWKIRWQPPFMMVLLLLGGILGAIGHHEFYSSLDGEPTVKQLRMVRYGTALAFFTKACLVGSVMTSFKQRIWHTFRSKAMSIYAIDGLFAVIQDPRFFFRWEMLKNAKLASLMALTVWLIPIAAMLSPASLTSGVKTTIEHTTCPTVPSLDFARESNYNFRNVTSFAGYSLFFVNTTDAAAGDGYFDYFDQPSKIARRLTITSAYLERVSSGSGAAEQACGDVHNCTYSIEFTGPGYDCELVANGSSNDQSRLDELGATFNMSILVPEGDMVYYSDVDTGEYADPQLPTNNYGVPFHNSSWPEDLGVFKAEPVLWIGQSIDTGEAWPEGSPYAQKWDTVRQPKIFRCTHKTADYQVNMTFVNSIQDSDVTNRTFLDPIIDTSITVDPNNSTNLTITPESNYVRPTTDVERYKLTAAYHTLGMLLRDFLRGSISHVSDGTYPLTRSDISETRLVDSETSYPVADLQTEVQSLYEDMILTLLSSPHLVIATNVSKPCIKVTSDIAFEYNVHSLWMGYAIAIAVTFVFLIVGGLSIQSNGVASDTRFSRIMFTTRNPTIDRMGEGACLGGVPFPVDIEKVKLRFGVLQEDNVGDPDSVSTSERIEHCAFGIPEETGFIVKGGVYT